METRIEVKRLSQKAAQRQKRLKALVRKMEQDRKRLFQIIEERIRQRA